MCDRHLNKAGHEAILKFRIANVTFICTYTECCCVNSTYQSQVLEQRLIQDRNWNTLNCEPRVFETI